MSPKSQIELVPWDSESPNHLDRLVEQRVQCGWHEGKVKTSWRDEQREGTKCIYWIVRELILEISPVDSSYHFRPFRLEIQNKPRNSISISRNIQEFVSNSNTMTLYLIKTQEKKTLQDTSASIRGVSRTPTRDDFHPVGHISLDTINPELKAKGVTLDLPSKDVYWIKSFYVSTALRSQHIGGAAMAAAESIAVSEPLCAQTLVLDTLYKGDQMREDLATAHWGAVPKVNYTLSLHIF